MLRPMPDPQQRADRRTIAAGVLAMVLLSGNFVASRHGLANGLSVADLLLLRTAVAGLLLGVVLWRIGLGGLPLHRAGILTLLAGAPYFLLTIAAVQFAPATHASILNPGGTMLFAPLLGWWVLRQGPEIGVRVGLFILAAGLLLIGGASLAEGGSRAWIGDLMLVFSGLIWALYGVLMRHWQVPGARAAAVTGTISLLWVPVHLGTFGLGGLPAHPQEAMIQAVYQGVISGGVAVLLYSRAVALLGPARGALLPPLVPALGVFWAWLLLGEAVTATQVAGMVLVIIGMLCGALWRGPAMRQRTDPAREPA
jgi:drug/metabolite transporter (DMT)-like permease